MSESRKRLGTLGGLKRELSQAADPKRANNPIGFKTNKGDYAEHDQFMGVSVPRLRTIAGKYQHLKLAGIDILLRSRWLIPRTALRYAIEHLPEPERKRFLTRARVRGSKRRQ